MQVSKTGYSSSKVVIVSVILVAVSLSMGYFVGQMATQTAIQTASVIVPPVKGFYKGQEILFIHTEASDEQVASMLTMMMGSPVLVVPSLKEIPASSLGDVFVFTNGVRWRA